MRAKFQVEVDQVLTVGHIALSSERWAMRFGPRERMPFVRTSGSTAVLHQTEGAWKFLIVAPWGWQHR
jgi:hypothetical protein